MRQTIPPAGLLVTGLWLEQPSSDIEIDNGEVWPVFTNTISPVSVSDDGSTSCSASHSLNKSLSL